MPQYIITPWRDSSELVGVRRQLYRLGDSRDIDERRHAIDLIAAWKLRGNLPHAVESTALLVDAILHQDGGKHSNFSIRAVYSAAFCRFVTGFCDSEQNSFRKKPMNDVAKEIDMPASFVELRHEATHGDLPSLSRLQRNAGAALKWLWHHYWATLDVHSNISDTTQPNQVESAQGLEDQLREHLKTYLSVRLGEVRKDAEAPKHWADSSRDLALKITRLCQGKKESLQVLAKVLFEEKMMIPSQKMAEPKMDGSFLIWDEPLRKVGFHQSLFLRTLVEHMTGIITLSSRLNMRLDRIREAACQWLIHIFTSTSWDLGTRRQNLNELRALVVQACIMNPNVWTHRVIRPLIDNADDSFKGLWAPLYNESLPQSNPRSRRSSTAVSDTAASQRSGGAENQADAGQPLRTMSNHSLEGTPSAASGRTVPDQSATSEGVKRGWRKWQGPWRPKPIGTIDA